MTVSRLERLRAQPLYLIATLPPGLAGPAAPEAGDWLDRVAAAVEAGLGLVQLRAKASDTAGRRAWLAALRARLPAETLLVVNDDLDALGAPDGAMLADGVHLGRDDARALAGGDLAAGLRAARERLGPDLLLGTSTRTLEEVTAAVEAGCDHVGFGAMSASPTKQDTTRADPAELARCAAAHPALPLYPIGGLGPDTVAVLDGTGVRRAAVGSAVLDADDPARVVAQLMDWARGVGPQM